MNIEYYFISKSTHKEIISDNGKSERSRSTTLKEKSRKVSIKNTKEERNSLECDKGLVAMHGRRQKHKREQRFLTPEARVLMISVSQCLESRKLIE